MTHLLEDLRAELSEELSDAMLVIGKHDFIFRAFIPLLDNHWVALEDIELSGKLEEISLSVEVFEGGDCLLSLLAIVFLRKVEELHEEGVGRKGVLLYEHGKGGDFISRCTLGEHCEVPISLLRLLQTVDEGFVLELDKRSCLFVEGLSDFESADRDLCLLDLGG